MNWRFKIALTAVFSLVVTSIQAQDLRALEIGKSFHFSFATGEYRANQYNPSSNQVWILRYNLPYRVALRASIGIDYKYLNESIYKDANILHVPEDIGFPEVKKQWNIQQFNRLTIAVEYHFKDFNIYDARTQFSPYLMIGLSNQSNFLTSSKLNDRISYLKEINELIKNEEINDEEKINVVNPLLLSDLRNEGYTDDDLLNIYSIRDELEEFIPDFLLSKEKNQFSFRTFGLIGSFGVKYRVRSLMILSAEIAGGYFFSDDYDYNISKNIYSFRNRSGNDFYLYPNLTLSVSLGPVLRLFND